MGGADSQSVAATATPLAAAPSSPTHRWRACCRRAGYPSSVPRSYSCTCCGRVSAARRWRASNFLDGLPPVQHPCGNDHRHRTPCHRHGGVHCTHRTAVEHPVAAAARRRQLAGIRTLPNPHSVGSRRLSGSVLPARAFGSRQLPWDGLWAYAGQVCRISFAGDIFNIHLNWEEFSAAEQRGYSNCSRPTCWTLWSGAFAHRGVLALSCQSHCL